ncbi:MAG TPA: endonuclease III, partial [Thermodesulfobacteriota bacterium]|nr:endonuclease III [Thermodesulfobacteriota bacterium]
KVPDTLEDLVSLPGVGRKTANIVLGNAFGTPALAVDTHVKRVSQRLGLTVSDDPDEIETDLTSVIPPKRWTLTTHLLIMHGRTTCIARKPRCPECKVSSLCDYFRTVFNK